MSLRMHAFDVHIVIICMALNSYKIGIMKGGYLSGNGQTEVEKEENRNSKENKGSITLTDSIAYREHAVKRMLCMADE